MPERRFQVGDTVEVIHYTPTRYAPGVEDELGTERLFRRIVGKKFRIRGFDEYGYIELQPTKYDTIWIGPDDVRLAFEEEPQQG
jgi:hypothetical protein